jgi:putative ABC transport system substrate-binding protein
VVTRRAFIGTLTGGLLAAPLAVEAQPVSKIPRVGVLLFGTPDTDPSLRSFRAGLHDLGHVEGKTIVLEYHYAGGKPERLPDLAAIWLAPNPT